ncbi:MAG TPA: hypothetical protein VGP96_05330 [Candidatus Dormibacteraeota bacterium]|nr:hypothetical protein [Candidatus Dormibacteraeota bacterium]
MKTALFGAEVIPQRITTTPAGSDFMTAYPSGSMFSGARSQAIRRMTPLGDTSATVVTSASTVDRGHSVLSVEHGTVAA